MKNKIKKYVKLRKKVSHKSRLLNAWSKVYSNGITSSSYETRKGVEEFSKEVNRNLGHIETQLKKGTFRFLNSRGVAISREGKDPRPLVISPIQNRIVQRSILEILQSDKKLKTYFEVPTSFGGLKKKSVSDAIAFIHEKMKSGAVYFVRSDIKSFFTNIPKELVISLIRDNLSVKDDDFIKLLREAVTVELENLDKLTEVKDLFPLHEEGVAQGSCLSPLFGNIFLREFDEKTNSEDVFCVRFIDDFVILGSSEKAVKAKYKAGVKYLEKYNLELYDPFNSNDDKAEFGDISEGFNFLGCKISLDRISPSSDSVTRLKKKISERFELSKYKLSAEENRTDNLLRTLRDVSNILKGWGNSYQFCNNKNLFEELDLQVDKKISEFFDHYDGVKRTLSSSEDKRRLLGIHLLSDCKSDPIVGKNKK